MLARQRQALILERVREDGAVRVADLARELGVSDMTVRRDLEILHNHGLLEKVHGGATSLSGTRARSSRASPPSRRSRSSRRTRSPTRPPRLVEPGMAIAISAGTTTYALAARLADDPRASRWSPTPCRVAEVLYRSGRRDQTIILTGGVRTPSDALVGPFAVAALRPVHVDLVFMGVHGMDAQAGLHAPEPARGRDRPRADRAGRRLVVVADHTKWGVDRHQLDRAARPGRRAGVRRRVSTPTRSRPLRDAVGELVLVESDEPVTPVDASAVSRRRSPRRTPGPRARAATDDPPPRRPDATGRAPSPPSRTGATTR